MKATPHENLVQARLHEASHLLVLNATLGPGVASALKICDVQSSLDGYLRVRPSGHPFLGAIAFLAGYACDERLGCIPSNLVDPRSDYHAALLLLGNDSELLDEALGIARELIDDLWPSILDVAKFIESEGDVLGESQIGEIEDGVVAAAIQKLKSD